MILNNFVSFLDIASGCSQDWAYAEAGIVNSYTMELRPDSTDVSYGFQYPEYLAPSVGEETYRGLTTLMTTLKK